MIKHLILSAVFLLSSLLGKSQSWSKLDSSYAKVVSLPRAILASDNLGNIFVINNDSLVASKGHYFVNKFDGIKWQPLGHSSNALNPNAGINCILTDNNNNVYVAGGFTDSLKSNKGHCYVAKWNGSNWSQLGVGANALNPNSGITRMAINKNNGHIYVFGAFTNSLGRKYVAEWNGTNWSELGGSQSPFLNAPLGTESLNSLSVNNSGDVFVGVGTSNQHYYVAKWDGNNWSQLGTWVNGSYANNSIYSITTDNNGNVYAAGLFTDSVSMNSGSTYVAKWDGNNWSKLGTGNNALFQLQSQPIYSLATDNNGNLYAGGSFRNSLTKGYIAKWDGNTWNELGGLGSFPATNLIATLSLITDKFGAVYATGSILDSSGNHYVARYGFPLGVENIKERKNELVVYPNPCADKLLVNGYSLIGNSVEINDFLGRTCISILHQKSEVVNIETLTSGLYILKVIDAKGNLMTGKFVKE